jgi:hypothetical protein
MNQPPDAPSNTPAQPRRPPSSIAAADRTAPSSKQLPRPHLNSSSPVLDLCSSKTLPASLLSPAHIRHRHRSIHRRFLSLPATPSLPIPARRCSLPYNPCSPAPHRSSSSTQSDRSQSAIPAPSPLPSAAPLSCLAGTVSLSHGLSLALCYGENERMN